MSSVIILVTYLAEELQLQVVVFPRKEEYEVAVAGQLVDIIEYAVRAEEGIDPADGMDEDELGLLFFYEALDAGNDDGLDVEYAVECRYESSLEISLSPCKMASRIPSSWRMSVQRS